MARKEKVRKQKPENESDTAYRAVKFTETYTGKAFYTLNPNPKDVTIIDIAHHLANSSRYNGAPRFNYSVAQHSVLLALYAAKEFRASSLDCLQVLMHDGPETYLPEMPRPIKQFLPGYREMEHKIQGVIRKAFGLDKYPVPKFLDEIDSRIIVDERQQLLSDSGNDWQWGLEPLGVVIAPWSNEYAEQQFLLHFAAWYSAAFGKHAYFRTHWHISDKVDTVKIPPIKFKTKGNDIRIKDDDEPVRWSPNNLAADLLEVDLVGGVGRVRLRDQQGHLVRDPQGGTFPRASTKWVHGIFSMTGK